MSDLGNQFLCLVYCTWTWFLTQILHLLNSILCIKVCYAQNSVCGCHTGTCLLWETCKYLLVCNVLALYTTVADCSVSDYNRLLKKHCYVKVCSQKQNQIFCVIYTIEKTQCTICIATHHLHHYPLKIIQNVIIDETKVSEYVSPIKVKRQKFLICTCFQGTQAKPSNCSSCISIKNHMSYLQNAQRCHLPR